MSVKARKRLNAKLNANNALRRMSKNSGYAGYMARNLDIEKLNDFLGVYESPAAKAERIMERLSTGKPIRRCDVR